MSKVLDKSWKKLLVALVVFTFIGFASRQGVTAAEKQGGSAEAKSHAAHHDAARKGKSSPESKKAKTGGPQVACGESQEEISEAYNECLAEGCGNCGTWNR